MQGKFPAENQSELVLTRLRTNSHKLVCYGNRNSGRTDDSVEVPERGDRQRRGDSCRVNVVEDGHLR
jgi:hypothetical protein